MEYFPKTAKTAKTITEGLKKVKRNALPMLGGFLVNRMVHYGLDAALDDSTTEDVKEGSDTSKVAGRSLEKMSLKYAEKALAEHQSIKKSIQAFSKSITELLDFIEKDKNYSPPLFIMIDELDRCRPSTP